MAPETPFPCSYWVEPLVLLAGEYPGARSIVAARRKIEALLDCGIREIINLMASDERDYARVVDLRGDGAERRLAAWIEDSGVVRRPGD